MIDRPLYSSGRPLLDIYLALERYWPTTLDGLDWIHLLVVVYWWKFDHSSLNFFFSFPLFIILKWSLNIINLDYSTSCFVFCMIHINLIKLIVKITNLSGIFPITTFRFLLYDVLEDWSTTIVLWWVPFDLSALVVMVSHLDITRFIWYVCTKNNTGYYLFSLL